MNDNKTIEALDDGYVRLEDFLGDDLTPANAARASYRKKSDFEMRCPGCLDVIRDVPGSVKLIWCYKCEDHVMPLLSLKDGDKRLLRFLGSEGHTSPFRHGILQFEIRAPIMVARQWWKYVVGSAHGPNTLDWLNVHEAMGIEGEGYETPWNETSGRYVTQEWEFYNPRRWRQKAKTNKQGSGDIVDPRTNEKLRLALTAHINTSLDLYYRSLEEDNVAPELARLFLPYAGLYTNWYWTASLQTVAWFVVQRHPGYMGEHAQWEIQRYAMAVEALASQYFPVAFEELTKQYKDGGPQAEIKRLKREVERLEKMLNEERARS